MYDKEKYLEMPTSCLSADNILPFDLYIIREGNPVLWRGQKTKVKQTDIDQLNKSGVMNIYIGFNDKNKYLSFAEKNAIKIINNDLIPVEFKSLLVSDITSSALENLFKDPTNKTSAKRLENIIEPMVELILANEKISSLRFLLQRGDIVFSYIPHSARTCYYTVALADTFNKFSSKKLHQIGIAALLHDIGQTLVPMEIREKIGDYNENDIKEMQRHPVYSVDIVHKSDLYELDGDTLTAIKAHHELGDKSGYPHHLSLFELPLEAQILAVTHTFESYTTERIHREAKKSYDVIKYMLNNPKQFPVQIVRRFIPLLSSMEEY